jgi:hypothetical protein
MNSNYTVAEREFDFAQFKKFFLLEFTRQLIRHSAPPNALKLQAALEEKKIERIEEEKRRIIERIREREKELIKAGEKDLSTNAKEITGKRTKEMRSIIHPVIGMFGAQNTPHLNPFKGSFKKANLSIPESKFPVHIQYIKPIPINREIDLGNINPLIRDPMVRVIECHGPGENLVVQGNMGTKNTGIILSREEINETIERFSRETKIPIQEGVFRVVAGKLVFLAIISEIVGSKFIIKKMLDGPPRPKEVPRPI